VDVIFHLAAMKHVPAAEYNPFEAVQTNVLGTQNVIQAAVENNVERVIFSSSDKAISPTNAMGATKLLAERLSVSANYSQGSDTIFTSVRFGNVLGSRGSVIPLFKKQILENRRITITNKDMTRFMMSIKDAASLLLEAGRIAKGGEVFVLKMPVMRLSDIAEIVIEETCSKYGIDPSTVRVDEIGLRVGEKMFEELMTIEESEYAYEYAKMYSIVSPFMHGRTCEISNSCEKAPIQVYSSHDKKPLEKEAVRKLILSVGLI
jgi:FlaA1/EpsC-like NDP-sugar epimerase